MGQAEAAAAREALPEALRLVFQGHSAGADAIHARRRHCHRRRCDRTQPSDSRMGEPLPSRKQPREGREGRQQGLTLSLSLARPQFLPSLFPRELRQRVGLACRTRTRDLFQQRLNLSVAESNTLAQCAFVLRVYGV